MAQIGWVFLGSQGGRHRVGLYHGDRSGHVMIHCNLRIIQIDFSVKDTKSYTFFIEDELCKIRLVNEGDHFSYELVMDTKTDTPLNRVRRIGERRNRKYMAVMIGSLVLAITIVVVGLNWYGRQQRAERLSETSLFSNLSEQNEKRLASEGRTATARLYLAQESLRRKMFYGFVTVDSMRVNGQFTVPDTGQILLPNGFPLSDRDEFEVTYLPADPRVHRVEFFRPTRSTITTYIELANQEEQRSHPQDSPKRIICRILSAAEQKGWECLADFIFQTKTIKENLRHNHDSYLRLLREPALAKMLDEQCWDK